MRDARVTTLEHISKEDLTESWNRCWQGYYYNMTYSHNHLKAWLYLSHVSLQYSCAIYVGEKIVGFCLLSIDGADGWIAGTCIDPDYRRRGLFGLLMRAQVNIAKRLRLTKVYLEVLKQNNYALRVYQSVGFWIIRELNVYRVEKKVIDSKIIVEEFSLEPATLERYFKTRELFFSPSWQRKEGYLRRYKHSLAVMNLPGTAGALFAGENNIPLLDIWSLTSDGAEEVGSYLMSHLNSSFSLINQPQDWIVAYLSDRGISPNARQFEMCVVLS